MFEQDRRWVWHRQEARANNRWATRKIYSRQFRRITWHLSLRRGKLDLKTGEFLFISLPVSWKSLGTVSTGPSFVTLIQHAWRFSLGDGCAFGCKPLCGLLWEFWWWYWSCHGRWFGRCRIGTSEPLLARTNSCSFWQIAVQIPMSWLARTCLWSLV